MFDFQKIIRSYLIVLYINFFVYLSLIFIFLPMNNFLPNFLQHYVNILYIIFSTSKCKFIYFCDHFSDYYKHYIYNYIINLKFS